VNIFTHCVLLLAGKDNVNKADFEGRLCRKKIGLLYPPPGTETTRTRRRSIDGADIFHLGEKKAAKPYLINS
jgi:hypothetical protein